MDVPLLDLKTQNGALASELTEAFRRVLASGYYVLGPEVERFERALAAETGARHVLGLSSGTDAILLALMALEIGPGDEVLCPSFTFFATAGCVTRVGATPVFVDSLPDSFNLDPADARRRVTARTRAIIPVHLFGQVCDMAAVQALASERQLRVIEDAAQAQGATQAGRQAGTFGDCGTISFYPSKNLGALGDAGALLTNDDALYQRCRILRTHGMEPKYHHSFVGGNFRLDALQAALLSVKLPHLAAYSQRRAENARRYTNLLAPLPATHGERPRLVLPGTTPGNGHIWNQYTLRVTEPGRRDALRAHLTAAGIGSEIYYPLPLHEQTCFAVLGYAAEDFPVAHRLSGEVLSLPISPELELAAIEKVAGEVARFFST